MGGERGAGQGMVEATGVATEHVAVGGLAGMRGDHVDETAVDQKAQRVLVAVGVEVADDEHAVVPGLERIAGQPVGEHARRLDALGVVAALAVFLVAIGTFGVLTALGLEMVGDDDEVELAGDETLRQRRPRPARERAVGRERGRALGADAALAVDQADRDRVFADALDRRAHEGVIAAFLAARLVEVAHQLGQRRGLAVAVVLDLHQGDDVGVEHVEGGDDLRALALEGIGVLRAALGREAAALAVAVEVVQHVEGGDTQVAVDVRRLGRARRVRDLADRRDQLHAVLAVALLEHALDADDLGIDAIRRLRRQRVGQVPELLREFVEAGIVEHQPRRQVGLGQRTRGLARDVALGRRVVAAVERHDERAVPQQILVADQRDRSGDGDAFAFVTLPVGRGAAGGGDRARHQIDRLVLAADQLGDFDQGGLGVRRGAEFGDGGAHAHAAADRPVELVGMAHEDALGSRRIGVLAAGLAGQVETAEAVDELGADARLDLDLLADQRAHRLRALHGRDAGGEATAFERTVADDGDAVRPDFRRAAGRGHTDRDGDDGDETLHLHAHSRAANQDAARRRRAGPRRPRHGRNGITSGCRPSTARWHAPDRR